MKFIKNPDRMAKKLGLPNGKALLDMGWHEFLKLTRSKGFDVVIRAAPIPATPRRTPKRRPATKRDAPNRGKKPGPRAHKPVKVSGR